MQKKAKFGIGVVVILVSMGVLAWLGYGESKTYYHTIAELPGSDKKDEVVMIRRVRRRTALVPEDRVLAMRTGLGMAAVAPVEIARKLQAPVPAAGRLQEVAPDGSHRAQLRRGGGEPGAPRAATDAGASSSPRSTM